MKKPPCGGCVERHIGCHAKCERYLTWSAEHEKEREVINAAKAEDNRFREYTLTQIRGRRR